MRIAWPLLLKVAHAAPTSVLPPLESYSTETETIAGEERQQLRLWTGTEKTAQTVDPTGDESTDR